MDQQKAVFPVLNTPENVLSLCPRTHWTAPHLPGLPVALSTCCHFGSKVHSKVT